MAIITNVRERQAPMVEITSDVLDIARRIREGDELWRGDPTMRLTYNPDPTIRRFEVIGLDVTGAPYIAAAHDRCDQTLLIKLAEGDPRRGNVFERVMKHNEQVRKDREDAERDQRMEIADKMHWAIKQDLGQHLGGRRRLHGMYDGSKES